MRPSDPLQSQGIALRPRHRALLRAVLIGVLVLGMLLLLTVPALAGFGQYVTYATGPNPYSVRVADFNHDLAPDLAVAVGSKPAMWILLNNGDGTFAAAVPYSVNGKGWSLAVADFNHDGRPDVAVGTTSNRVSVRFGRSGGGFDPKVSYSMDSYANSLVAADLNGDGAPDLVGPTSVLMNQGDGTFGTAIPFGGSLSNPVDPEVRDLNKDGKLDLAAAELGSGQLAILLGNGDGTFGVPVHYPVGPFPDAVTFGRFDSDRKVDVAVKSEPDQISVLRGNGDGTFGSANTYTVPASQGTLITRDVNGDNFLDLISTDVGGDGSVSVLLGNGDGTFGAVESYPVASYPRSVAAADFNNDGLVDLAVASQQASAVSVLLGTP